MLNVCHGCGLYRADKVIAGPTPPGSDPANAVAICPECGYRHPFLRLPLLVVAGASGAGKSAVCHALLNERTRIGLSGLRHNTSILSGAASFAAQSKDAGLHRTAGLAPDRILRLRAQNTGAFYPAHNAGLRSGCSNRSKAQSVLARSISEAVLLDADILWRAEFDRPAEHYRDFFETWLRMAKNIGQSGRPVTLFGAGLGVPENVEPCVERRYFSQVRYLALVCADDLLAERLRARPDWRGNGAAWIGSQIGFNRWFREHAAQTSPPIQLLDTTGVSVTQTAAQVAAWILANLHGNQEMTSCAQTD